jgi:plasmid stabilization system protein ParE
VGWEVVFAPRSESDLAKIVSYIANDDPAAAIRFGETLINKAESLADVPGMGPLLPGKANTRFLPVGSYLIIYRPDERRRIVRILRFWHSARRQRPTR